MTMATLPKENIELGLGYSFRGLIYFHQGGTWWYVGRHGVGEGDKSSTS